MHYGSTVTLPQLASAPLGGQSVAERMEPDVGAPKQQRTWSLEWQTRAARAGSDWVVCVGVTVYDSVGRVVPLHMYLQSRLTEFAMQLSSTAGEPNERSPEAVYALADKLVGAVEDAVAHPAEMPDHWAATCAVAMLMGNFIDALVALLDVALCDDAEGAEDEDGVCQTVLAIDSHTLSVVAPRGYTRVRAAVPGATPRLDFYAVIGSESNGRSGMSTLNEDGEIAPSVYWGLMNALNVGFGRGSSTEARREMRAWSSNVMRRFQRTLLEAENICWRDVVAFNAKHA